MSAGLEHKSDRKGVLVGFLLELDRKVVELRWTARFRSDRGLDVRVVGDDDVLLGVREMHVGCIERENTWIGLHGSVLALDGEEDESSH